MEIEQAARSVNPDEKQIVAYFFNSSKKRLAAFRVYVDGEEIGKATPDTFVYGLLKAGKHTIRLVAQEWKCEYSPTVLVGANIGSHIYEWKQEFLSATRYAFEPMGPVITLSDCTEDQMGNWKTLKARTLSGTEFEFQVQKFRLALENRETWTKASSRPWHGAIDECETGQSKRLVATFNQERYRHPNDYSPDGFKPAVCLIETN